MGPDRRLPDRRPRLPVPDPRTALPRYPSAEVPHWHGRPGMHTQLLQPGWVLTQLNSCYLQVSNKSSQLQDSSFSTAMETCPARNRVALGILMGVPYSMGKNLLAIPLCHWEQLIYSI